MTTKQAVYKGKGAAQRQVIDTGHRTFDRQVSSIGAGQILASTQTAFVIRARTTVMNGPHYGPFPEGYLQQWDLDHFPRRMTPRLRARIEELTATQSVLLHVFFHHNGPNWDARYVEHGFIAVQRDEHDQRRVVGRWRTGATYRSEMVLDGVTPYITDQED